MSERPKTAPYNEPIPGYGDVLTVREYIEAISQGVFNDDDGHGIVARNGLMDSRNICPSDGLTYIPEDATHIVWFNK